MNNCWISCQVMADMKTISLLLTCTLFNIWHFFTGEGRGRFKASEIVSDPNRKDCYLATLTIADMISSDSRLYFVTIANDRGETRYGINARVCMNAQWVEKKFWWITYSNCILYIQAVLCLHGSLTTQFSK